MNRPRHVRPRAILEQRSREILFAINLMAGNAGGKPGGPVYQPGKVEKSDQ